MEHFYSLTSNTTIVWLHAVQIPLTSLECIQAPSLGRAFQHFSLKNQNYSKHYSSAIYLLQTLLFFQHVERQKNTEKMMQLTPRIALSMQFYIEARMV
mmetsp:Transcript_59833/g.159163  ORF Transcript_59833/g.159163 Transcript_59833/m.159163 type:complete len:98 (+) Transcript_59833:212-505(+)